MRRQPKACVVVPSVSDFYFTRRRHTSLGARILAELLAEAGIATELIDFPASAKRAARRDRPQCLDHLTPFLDPDECGPLSWFGEYRRLGPPPAIAARRIATIEPDIVFLSSFAFAYAEDAIALAAEIRRIRPEITIVAGGAGPSVHPEYYVDGTEINVVVTGAADGVIESIFELAAGAAGASRRRSGSPRIIRATPEARRSVRFVASLASKRLTTIVTRGCPRRCRFCSVHLTQGDYFRTISPDAFAAGLDRYRNDEVTIVNFEDDSLLAEGEFLREILASVRRMFPEAEIRAENGLDPAQLDASTIELLARSGMRRLDLSIGTVHRDSLEHERRTDVVDRLPGLVAAARSAGMPVTLYWICGLELDTTASVLETLALIDRLGASSGISVFYPVPGLSGFPVTRFPRPGAPLATGSATWPWNGSLSTREMITAFRLSRLVSLRSAGAPLDGTSARLLDRCFTDRRLHTLKRSSPTDPIPVSTVDGGLEARFFELRP